MKIPEILSLAAATWPSFAQAQLITLPPISGDSFALTVFRFQPGLDSPAPQTPVIAIIHGSGEWERIESFAEAFKSRHQDVYWDTYTEDIPGEKLVRCPHTCAAGARRWRTDLPQQAPHFCKTRL